MKKPIKEMQKGGKERKKPIILRPDYRNLQLARSYNNAQLGNKLNTPATKQDSTDYKTGFIRGVKGWKPSADRLKYEGEGEYQKMGRWEGQNSKKEALSKKKTGGKVTKAKNGKSFPDLNKDGKITKADILKGRGVIAKKGMTVKKAQNGAKTADSTSYFRGRAKDMARKSLYAEGKGDKKLSDVYMDVASKSSSDASRQANKGQKGYDKNGYPLKKKAKTGASVKKCRYGCK